MIRVEIEVVVCANCEMRYIVNRIEQPYRVISPVLEVRLTDPKLPNTQH